MMLCTINKSDANFSENTTYSQVEFLEEIQAADNTDAIVSSLYTRH